MASYDAIADLPITIEACSFEGLSISVGDFERATTLIKFEGAGHEGIGEDVTYDVIDHIAQQDAGPPPGLLGTSTFDEFSQKLDGIDLFPAAAPQREPSVDYRRWAFESAALDLALRQAGTNLAAALGREARPLNFVSSLRLAGFEEGARSSIAPVTERLAANPGLRFKLDPFNDWDDELIAALVATGAVDSLDLKGFYKGTPVDVITDPELYSKLIEAFPDAWLEDPDVTDETRPLLDPVHERVTWDAPIHSIADIEAMPWSPPRTVNVKPSRFGPISRLFAAYDYCEEHGIAAYGGGQTELGPGRGQIQYLASIFHPDTPNDTAPIGYNDPAQATRPGLPSSPLEPAIDPLGFRWTGPQTA
jgi:L-alanine-DL-glutamate epimerase-like enolase superfamily enzyme